MARTPVLRFDISVLLEAVDIEIPTFLELDVFHCNSLPVEIVTNHL